MEQTRQKLRATSFMKWGVITMLVTTLLSVVFVMFSTLPAAALGTVPTKMNFQGRLTNASGVVLTNGTYNMKFRIFTVSSGGSSVWSEDRLVSATQGVTVNNGLFSVRLGDVTSLPTSIFTGATLYFEIELPTPATATTSSPSWTEGAMTPRNQLATSAYAYNADMLDGLDGTDFAQVAGTNVFTGSNTIQSGGTLLLKSNMTNSFQVTKSAGTNLFNVDTTSAQLVTVGSTTTDATAILFELDSYNNATDPTGVNGDIYYNSSLNAFRCKQNGAWTNCIGTGASPTLQDAYNNSSSPATITTSSGTKGVLVKAGATFDQADLFDIQNAAGNEVFSVDTTNNRIQIGDTVADTTGTVLVLDTKNNAGDPTGVDGAMYYNSSLAEFRCYRDGLWGTCSTLPIDRGWEFNDDFLNGGTVALSAGLGTNAGIGQLGWASATVGTICVAYSYNNTTGAVPSSDRPGILKIQTSGTATANAGCKIYLGTTGAGVGGTMNLAAGQVIKAAIAPGSATAGAIDLRVGADAQVVGTKAQITTSGVWWEADPTTNANWQYCFATGAAATCANSTVAIAANTFAHVEISITATGSGTSSATFKISSGVGGTVNTYTVSSVTINTASAVRPSIMCTTGATATSSIPCYADYFQMRGDTSGIR